MAERKLVAMRLVKHVSDDGLAEWFEHIPIGTWYYIDPATVRTVECHNTRRGMFHHKRIADSYDVEGRSTGYVFVDLLAVIEGDIVLV